jgi:hypothetical protein
VVAATAAVTIASPAQAADAPRVVIVVGPAGRSTGDYLRHARAYADQARRYGASVQAILHPHATWSRVVSAAQGANVFIYLGHGNGWPSPYAPYQGDTKNGLGLNPYDGAGAGKVRYYGENQLRAHIRLAPGAIVLLNRLCYASGNGEPGFAEPSWRTAVRRADNYAAGFLDAGASAVLADGHTSLGYELGTLFARTRTVLDLWRDDPDTNGHERSFSSARTSGATVRLDPDRRSAGFYRSLVTRGGPSTGAIRLAAYWGATRDQTVVRTVPSGSARALTRLADGARYVVRDRLATDGHGRTWAPVMTRTGVRGWVPAWKQAFSGSARPRVTVILRSGPSTGAGRNGTVRDGTRVTVLRSSHDRQDRAWLKVRKPSGRTGWIAAWLTRP